MSRALNRRAALGALAAAGASLVAPALAAASPPDGADAELLALVRRAKALGRACLEIEADDEETGAAIAANLCRLWREIATTPARTAAGVIAKIAAVANFVEPAYPAGEWPDRATAEDVIAMAAVDFAALTTEV